MLILPIWWAGILVESLILLRAARNRTLGKFPFFFVYIASVLGADVVLFVVHVTNASAYPVWAGRAELLNIVLGYSITLEIFRHVLSRYPGVDRFAQIAGLIIVGLILCFATLHPSTASPAMDARSQKAILERDFLAVQTLFLFGTIAVIGYYSLEVGKNITGIILGYGIWLGASVITLEFMAYIGSPFNATWVIVQPFFYLLALIFWLRALWNYAPVGLAGPAGRPTAGYESLASATRGLIGEMRDHLGRVGRL